MLIETAITLTLTNGLVPTTLDAGHIEYAPESIAIQIANSQTSDIAHEVGEIIEMRRRPRTPNIPPARSPFGPPPGN